MVPLYAPSMDNNMLILFLDLIMLFHVVSYLIFIDYKMKFETVVFTSKSLL